LSHAAAGGSPALFQEADMATPSQPMMSPAAADLGMGDALQQQAQQAEIERKKKLMRQANGMNVPMGLAASQLFPGSGGYGNI
jgi:hypothetical protein